MYLSQEPAAFWRFSRMKNSSGSDVEIRAERADECSGGSVTDCGRAISTGSDHPSSQRSTAVYPAGTAPQLRVSGRYEPEAMMSHLSGWLAEPSTEQFTSQVSGSPRICPNSWQKVPMADVSLPVEPYSSAQHPQLLITFPSKVRSASGTPRRSMWLACGHIHAALFPAKFSP